MIKREKNMGIWLIILYCLIFGVFSIIQKYTANNLSWQTHMTFIWGSAFIFNLIFVFRFAEFQVSKYTWVCIGLGLLASLGTICMYKALNLLPLSKVHIINNFVFVLPVLSSFIIYGEKITIRKIIAIIFALIAIILLLPFEDWIKK